MKLTFILFFTCFTVLSQNVKGVVLEAEINKPLENVNIYFEKGKKGTVTDENGEFELKLQSAINVTDTLHFSFISYKSVSYTFQELKELNFEVHLVKTIENLSEVTLKSNIKLDRSLTFTKLSALKNGVYGFGSALVGGKIYVVGGDISFIDDNTRRIINNPSNNLEPSLNDLISRLSSDDSWQIFSDKLQVYDIKNDVWSESNLEFRKRAYHKVIHAKDNLYVFGGKRLSANGRFEYLDDKLEVFNLSNQQFDIDNTNPHQAINFASFPYKDNIIAMGGSIKLKKNGDKIYTDMSHVYNVTSGYWYELPKMTQPKEVEGVIVDDKIYLIGGFNKTKLTEIESFDLITGLWYKEGDLFDAIDCPALTVHNQTIYIFDAGKMLTYDTKSKILTEYKINLNFKASGLQCYENKIYIIGGYRVNQYSIIPTSGLYAVNLSTFSKTQVVRSTKFDE